MKEGKGADIKAGSGRGDQNRAGSSNPAPKAAPNHELCPKRNHQLLPKGEQSVSRTAPPSHTGLFAGNVVISPFISQKIALTPSLGAEKSQIAAANSRIHLHPTTKSDSSGETRTRAWKSEAQGKDFHILWCYL